MQACLGKAKGRDSLSLIQGSLDSGLYECAIALRLGSFASGKGTVLSAVDPAQLAAIRTSFHAACPRSPGDTGLVTTPVHSSLSPRLRPCEGSSYEVERGARDGLYANGWDFCSLGGREAQNTV